MSDIFWIFIGGLVGIVVCVVLQIVSHIIANWWIENKWRLE